MKRFVIFLFLIILFFLCLPVSTWAVSEEECRKISDPNDRISCLNNLLTETGKKEESLTNEIIKFNASIALTSAQIQKTQGEIEKLGEEINALSAKIDRLEESLGQLSNILLVRIVETYKQGNIQSFHLLFSSSGFSDFLTRLKYIKVVQAHDKKLMFEMQATKDNYTDQKTLREEKKKEQEDLRRQLEGQKAQLAQQRKDREYFLEITRSDEKRYQNLLAEALAEQAAMRQALASLADRKFEGHVKEGEVIGVQGRTGRATGDHLHFAVYKSPYRWNVDSQNPLDYLRNGTFKWPIDSYNDGHCYQNVDGRCLSQPWGVSEISKSLGWYPNDFHDAIDVYAQYGALIKATGEGDISYGVDNQGGKYAIIKHTNGLVTTYWHFQ